VAEPFVPARAPAAFGQFAGRVEIDNGYHYCHGVTARVLASVAPTPGSPPGSSFSIRRRLLRRTAWSCAALAIALVTLVVVSGAVGSVEVSLAQAAQITLGHLVPGMPWMSDGTLTPLQDQAVWQFRLPRTLLAGLAGAGLALAGALMQVTVRNPLAEPYILGVSSGASVGAVLEIVR
jgi:iron complex transport system permease protein